MPESDDLAADVTRLPVHAAPTVLPAAAAPTVLPSAAAPTVLPGEAKPTVAAGGGATEPAPPTNQPVVRLEIGDAIVSGRYRVEQVIRGGAEGDAYRGTRIIDGARVFIKHQHRGLGKGREGILERLQRCEHPNCVRLLDFELADRPIEVYQWTEGPTLSEYLRANPKPDEGSVRSILAQLGEAVHYLQTQLKVAHRDVKPENIVVVDAVGPKVVLVDYGILTLADMGGLTSVAGTLKYAAPESRVTTYERKGFLPYDWWSIGRVLQEIVDGVHPYDQIERLFPNVAKHPEARESEWQKILYEVSVPSYGRAGQVEHSNSAWKKPLRGLLTSDPEKRWGYEELHRYLNDENVVDHYDDAVSIKADVPPSEAELLAEIARLSQEQHWDEAVQQVLEGRGVVSIARNQLGNKRLIARLNSASELYDELEKDGVALGAREDIYTMFTLKAIGGDTVPFSLWGYELNEITLLARAKRDAASAADIIYALSTKKVVERVKMLDLDSGVKLEAFAKQWHAVWAQLKAFNASESTLKNYGRIALAAFQSRERNDVLIEESHETLSHCKIASIDAAYKNVGRSDVEAAALAFLLPHAQNWEFVSKETVHKERVQGLAHNALRLRAAHGWATLRTYIKGWGFLLRPYAPWALGAAIAIPFGLALSPSSAQWFIDGLFFFGVLIVPGIALARQSAKGSGQANFGGCLMAVGGISVLAALVVAATMGGFWLVLFAIGAGLAMTVLQKKYLSALQEYVKRETNGGWFNDKVQVAHIDTLIKEQVSENPLPTRAALQERLEKSNREILAAPREWNIGIQPNLSDGDAKRAFRRIWEVAGGIAVAGLVLGLILHVIGFAGHSLFPAPHAPAAKVGAAANKSSGALAQRVSGLVEQYYSLWNAHRLEDAYQLLSSQYRSGHPYSEWASTHDSVVSIAVTTSTTNDPMTVHVVVDSVDRTNTGTTRSRYRGTWTAIAEGDQLRLDSVALNRVSL